MSERAAAIEAAALEVAAQLAEKQRELNRRRREAALAAKAALVEQMKASIAEIDTEILVSLANHTPYLDHINAASRCSTQWNPNGPQSWSGLEDNDLQLSNTSVMLCMSATILSALRCFLISICLKL